MSTRRSGRLRCAVHDATCPAIESLERRRLLSVAGDLDPSFGAGGLRSLTGFAPLLSVEGVAAARGKIVLSCNVADEPGIVGQLAVIRLDSTGKPDPTFGGGDGMVRTSLEGAAGVAILPDGRILAAAGGVLVRLRTDGSFDRTFGGGDGIAERPENAGGPFALAPDGKILIAGYDYVQFGDSTGDYFSLTRMLPNGSIDRSFGGGDGQFRGHKGVATCLAIEPDGQTILVGELPSETGSIGVQRVTASGSADPSFGGGDGFVPLALGDGSATTYGVTIDSAGRILVGAGGASEHDGTFNGHSMPIRLHPDGSIDQVFEPLPVLGIADLVALGGVSVAPDGKVLFVASDLSTNTDFPGPFQGAFVARYMADGKLDRSFGVLGYAPIIGPDFFSGPSPVLLPDGRLLSAGFASDSLSARYFDQGYVPTVAQYLYSGDGQPDAPGFSLASDGTLTLRGTSNDDFIEVRGFHDSAAGDLVRVTTNYTQRLFSRSAIHRTVIDLGAGDDTALVQCFGIPSDIRAGDGDDYLSTGTGADHLDGGAGNDQLWSDQGIVVSSAYPLFLPAADPTPGRRSSDVLIGGDGNDWLIAGPGFDTADGSAGDDYLVGDDGNDTLRGGDGDDSIEGGRGDDWIDGGRGADSMYAGFGRLGGVDTLSYADRTVGVFVDLLEDHYHGGEPGEGDHAVGFTIVIGGKGNDVLRGSDAVGETFYGNGGDDILVGRGGNDTLVGGAGRDRLYGGAGNDLLFGDGQSATDGATFADFLEGNAGLDRARKDPKDQVLHMEGFI